MASSLRENRENRRFSPAIEGLVLKCSHGGPAGDNPQANNAVTWTYSARSEGFEPPTF
jgi:hypothetical protein